mmetsp:Transcript_22697/g.44097  ORF Transcript_22697/g.44097 Transcript_22697/m.44097 type:complete len:268 (-) Transcript_22697:125-928(-)
MKSVDRGSNEGQGPKGMAKILGLDKCCDMFGLGGKKRGGQSAGAAMMARQSVADDTWMGAVGGLINNAMDAMGAATERTVEQHADELCSGGLFWRKQPNKEPKTVWLALNISDDETEAFVEWRNPQLVLNRAVDKESVPLANVQKVRGVAPGDELFFPEGSIAAGTNGVNSAVVLETNRGTFVFEAANAEERDKWIESLNKCVEQLVPKLFQHAKSVRENARAKAEKDRLAEQQRSSRESRRKEYAGAGMANTARIMAKMSEERDAA